ncbi:MAG TPA: DUF308 domain-containing protein [Micromonosporaceae bacterium]|nr:DUF308 domain-containing protein [Micromonosporaceae bacterium]
MTAGGARRGRRDNGLDAAEYVVAGDVDPRVGEHLLDVLAVAGIAAYLQPSADLNPITRTTTVPPRPIDRLYVDRLHLATARGFMARLADEPVVPAPAAADRSSSGADPDIDAAWAKIVAGFHAAPVGGTPPWPAAEDLSDVGSTGPARADDEAGPTADPTTEPAAAPRRLPFAGDISGISVGRRAEEPSLLDGLDTFGADLPDDAEEGYTPPPPPPLPTISKYAVAAVLAIVAGFVLFLFPTLLPIDRGMAILVGFAGIIGGFVTLILRLRPGDEDDYDPDDGAVV